MTPLYLGTKVVVDNNDTLTGMITGYGVENGQFFYIVKLEKGFWSKDETQFVSKFIVHSDNVVTI